ncbi:matrix metalloproteinase-21 [Trichonephila clavipes]|uniref:Matrix metalloproteinase-21 n=1 Tax=Trichonephila clavipes TaxID=2585209 RepID=A0A8X6WI76_TRICX|nr:matrix metalloproteinase-21 [Trichonephila clavipes]
MEILKRYGYLRCGSSKRRASSSSKHKEGRHGRRCTNEEIRHAIRRYQNTYNMPVTGQLDQATLKLMSESRCGNPDDESRAARFKPMIHPRKRHWRKGHSYQPLARHKRDISSNLIEDHSLNQIFESESIDVAIYDEDNLDGHSKEDRNLKKPHEATSKRLTSTVDSNVWGQAFPISLAKQSSKKVLPVHELVLGERRVSSEEPLPTGTSVTRRKRWLEKYLKDLESGQLDKKLEHQYKKMKTKRRRRSVSTGVEGQSFTNVRDLLT